MENRLRWLLHDLDPDFAATIPLRKIHMPKWRHKIADYLDAAPGSVGASICRDALAHIVVLTERADVLEREITDRVSTLAPSLLALPGCGALSAAKLVAETGRPDRFTSGAAFAMFSGTAPIRGASHRQRSTAAVIGRSTLPSIESPSPNRECTSPRRPTSPGDDRMHDFAANCQRARSIDPLGL